MLFFSYDPNGDGYRTHKTEKEAKDTAQAALDAEREEAYEGWDSSVVEICWGKIVQKATEVPHPTMGKHFVDYVISNVSAA